MDRRPFAASFRNARTLKTLSRKKKVYPRDRGFRSWNLVSSISLDPRLSKEVSLVSSRTTFPPSIVCPENRRYRVTKIKKESDPKGSWKGERKVYTNEKWAPSHFASRKIRREGEEGVYSPEFLDRYPNGFPRFPRFRGR